MLVIRNARIISLFNINIMVYDGFNSNNLGSRSLLIYGKVGNSATLASFMYADRDVTITGSYRAEVQVNFSMLLKKGWNIVYEDTYNYSSYSLTTTPVSGLKWYFEEDFYGGLVVSGSSKGSLKQLFLKK